MKAIIATAAVAAIAGAANAQLFQQGTLPNDGNGLLTDIVFVQFSVATAGDFEFQLNGNGGVDIGNGPSTLDAYLIIANDDGDRTADDILGADDDGGALGNDSLLNINLAAGDYIAALSAFLISDSEFVDGVNASTLGGTTPDYQFIGTGITGSFVPAPSAAALAGLAGLAAVRRRR